MLPWIQVYSNLAEHPKIYALVDRLGLRRNYEAVGIVVSLWLWAAKNAPNGDLSGFPERAIAAAIGVNGKKEKVLCKALVETGWLDEKSSGGFLIHDWDEYAELLIAFEKKQRRLGKARVERYRKKMCAENDTPFQKKSVTATKIDNSNSKCNAEISVTDVNCNAENGVTSAKCNAYTKPDQTKQNQTISVCPPSAPSSSWSKKALCELCQPRLTLSDNALEELLELSQGMEEAVLRRALDIAQDNGKMLWGYVRGILRNWQQEGVRTTQQVELREQRRREERIGSAAKASASHQNADRQCDAAGEELAAAVKRSRAAMKRMLEGE